MHCILHKVSCQNHTRTATTKFIPTTGASLTWHFLWSVQVYDAGHQGHQLKSLQDYSVLLAQQRLASPDKTQNDSTATVAQAYQPSTGPSVYRRSIPHLVVKSTWRHTGEHHPRTIPLGKAQVTGSIGPAAAAQAAVATDQKPPNSSNQTKEPRHQHPLSTYTLHPCPIHLGSQTRNLWQSLARPAALSVVVMRQRTRWHLCN